MRRGDEATHPEAANTRRELANPALTMYQCLHMCGTSGHARDVLVGGGGVAPPLMARVAFETRAQDLRTAARWRRDSNMRRGDEATHPEAANTCMESANPALTMQQCLHMRGASGHARDVLMGDGGVAPPLVARVAFETRVRDLRTAARWRGGSNMRRGEEATYSSGEHVQGVSLSSSHHAAVLACAAPQDMREMSWWAVVASRHLLWRV